jgi:peptidoglycan/xylan/chitin deacetylase (PgdA/CDA1 family)
MPASAAPGTSFPGGARAAVTLTFDDARPSQLDVGLPILDRHGVRATFYVVPGAVRRRAADWRNAATRHEIGGHTATHPTSVNHGRAGDHTLEMFTTSRIKREAERADAEVEALLGVRPRTFAYTGGYTFVGSGRRTRSYVPIIARRYLAGRGYRSDVMNDPALCDLARLEATHIDGFDGAALAEMVDAAVAEGRWLVVVAHEVGESGPLSLSADALDALCQKVANRGDIWVAPVIDVARHLQANRGHAPRSELRRHYLGLRASLGRWKRVRTRGG